MDVDFPYLGLGHHNYTNRDGTWDNYKYAQKNLLDLVQITTSIPEKEPLHPLRPNILWIKNSYDQPNLAPWFSDKNNHNKYNANKHNDNILLILRLHSLGKQYMIAF